MKFPLLAALAGILAAACPARAQSPSPSPKTLYPDSPARANPNPRAVTPPPRPPGNNTDDGKRGPRGPLDWERTAALSPDGRLFVTLNLDGRMRVWEVASGKSEVELPAGVIEVVFSPDSRLLACLFEKLDPSEGTRYWQVFAAADGKPAGEPIGKGQTYSEFLKTVVFAPDGKRVAGFVGTGANVGVGCWNVDDGKVMAVQPIKELLGGGALVFSPDGKTLAAVGSGSAVVLLNAADLKPLRTLPAEGKSNVSAAFSPDGRLLAVGGDEQRTVNGQRDGFPCASLYEVAGTRPAFELKIVAHRGGRVRQIVFADGGRGVVTATDKSAQAWSSADGRLLAFLPEAGFPLALSPDGKTLAGSQSPDLACWDTAAWHLRMKIANARAGYGTGTGMLGYVPLAFAPDGSLVTLRNNSVTAYELPGGRPLAERAATQSRVVH